MGCELWIRGDIFYEGQIYPNRTRKVRDWTASSPIPAITFSYYGPGGTPYSFYIDNGFGASSGTGWTSPPTYYTQGCVNIPPNQPYDCISGGCLPKTTYNTPGVFANLAACQSGCAKNSNCTGECVDPAEIAAHQQAINNLKAKIC